MRRAPHMRRNFFHAQGFANRHGRHAALRVDRARRGSHSPSVAAGCISSQSRRRAACSLWKLLSAPTPAHDPETGPLAGLGFFSLAASRVRAARSKPEIRQYAYKLCKPFARRMRPRDRARRYPADACDCGRPHVRTGLPRRGGLAQPTPDRGRPDLEQAAGIDITKKSSGNAAVRRRNKQVAHRLGLGSQRRKRAQMPAHSGINLAGLAK